MKSWKSKVLPTLLAASLTFTYGAAASAKGNDHQKGNEKSKAPQVKIEKHLKLKDIQNHWAQRTIELMSTLQIIKGYDDYTFRPQNHVTQAEAIVMVVRLLELENDKVIEGNSTLSFGNVPFWAKGSIQFAIEEGIISSKEALQPNKPATRLFVTKLLVNALGSKLGIDGDKASLYFKDVAGLSNEDKTYLTFAVLQSLVKGYGDKTFQPNKPVTRAEMAALIERLKDYKEDHGDKVDNSLNGTVESLGDNQLTIEKDGKDTSYEVDDDVRVYIDQKSSDFDSLKVGMKIRVVLQEDGQIGFIDAYTTDETEETDLGWMEDIKEFKAELSDEDKKVEISFKPGDDNFEAKIEVTGEDDLSGNAALTKIEDLLEEAGMDDANDRFDAEDFIKAVADEYDLENEVEVELKLSVGDKEYKYDDSYDLDESNDVEWGSLEKVSSFNLDLVTTGEKVKLTFEKTDDEDKYLAIVENTVGSSTVKKTGEDALEIIEKITDASVVDNKINFDKAVEKIDALYDLSGEADVEGKIVINNTSYTVDKEIDVTPEDDVLGDLTSVKELDLSFDSANKDVVYHFENKTTSYDAKVEVTEDGVKTTVSGASALTELKAIQELFTTDDNTVDLDRIVNWVDNKYDLEGNTVIKGTVKIGNSTYSIDQEEDLGGK